MIGRWVKGLLHLLVGGACAALVAWLAFGFTQTVLSNDGPARVAMVVLILLSGIVVPVMLLSPPVRPAEVALARALLDVHLTEPADPTSWAGRWRGLVWAVAVIGFGGLALLALLWCVPQGVWLGIAAFSPQVQQTLPAALQDGPRAVLALAGLMLVIIGIAVQPLLVLVLTRLAPRVLGPTAGDRLVQAEQQRLQLLRANNLARELHDSVGHALTAIGVQAEAGARVAGHDPDYARAALERISATTRQAVTELDEVLGTLRAGAEGEPGRTGMSSVVDLLGDLGPYGSAAITCDGTERQVDGAAARTAYRVVQEALTNARRHGSGEVCGYVRVTEEHIEVLIENPVGSAVAGAADQGGRGLVGMRERLALVGGTLAAGPAGVDGKKVWRLAARLPAHTQQDA